MRADSSAPLPRCASRLTCTTMRAPSCGGAPRTGRKPGPLLADIDQRRVETGSEAHDPAEMDAAGRLDVAALDMQFGRLAVLDPGGAPFAGAGGDQQLAPHRTR